MVEKIESDKSSDEDYLSEVSVDISDDDRCISSPDLKIIENHVKNIEKCIAELKHCALENHKKETPALSSLVNAQLGREN